ncbi:MAG TPA: sterol carrier protein domain-containing protein, partial [Bacteroidales bacterium]
ISFRLIDPLIEENNGLFQLEKGLLTRSSSGEGEQVTIPQLTQALLGYHPELLTPLFNTFEKQNPYMSLMLN